LVWGVSVLGERGGELGSMRARVWCHAQPQQQRVDALSGIGRRRAREGARARERERAREESTRLTRMLCAIASRVIGNW
jgi:hypothetical protein